MAPGIPTTPETWASRAKALGVENLSIRDISSVPSASKMEERAFLCLRTYWVSEFARDFKSEVLGISPEDFESAKRHLESRTDFRDFIRHVEETRNTKIPFNKIPDLGVFTLVRHFHLQITLGEVPDSSFKSVVSPIMTRARFKAAEAAAGAESQGTAPNQEQQGVLGARTPDRDEVPPFDMQGMMNAVTAAETPKWESRSRTPSIPGSQGSPLAGRGRPTEPQSRPSSTVSDTDGLTTRSGVSSGAAKVLYPPTPDEMIVNTSFILLATAVAALCPGATSEWNLIRLILGAQLQDAELDARTDGFLRGNDGKTVALVEVKTRARATKNDLILMQETTQMVTLIAQEGFPLPSTRRYESLCDITKRKSFMCT
ncbi:hypothetical protein FQN54_001548 [Arachnomyces sp. PD_36]|nr:hypothetical protein FQN54_001548 [Arachnomyces sp. PD_36]